MRRALFHYDLPPQLIAGHPPARRRDSRLLVLDGPSGQCAHRRFTDLLEYLQSGDLLVFNDTKVIRARLRGRKATGGRMELLVERLLDDPQRALVQLRASKPPRSGSQLLFDAGVCARVEGRYEDLYELSFAGPESVAEILDRIGEIPLPPYLQRAPEAVDEARYQTVYARVPGAVAAPTAGLHFDDDLLGALGRCGVETGFVTLHVGSGTFRPVRAEDIREHRLHGERIRLEQTLCDQIAATRARGGRVIAVGTTAVRSLETASDDQGRVRPFAGESDLFIYPGYRFRTVDALVTNFHLPESSLLMLVCAFAGYRATLDAYRAAVAESYRFFSYGDAMFITHNTEAAAELPE